jgi:cytochrome c biogenesis protein CcmG/thiol:disulfide interchange protein DsbE
MRALIAIGAALLGVACSKGEGEAGKGGVAEKVELGALAPAYATVALNGDSVSLASLRGKVVLFNIWATCCHPCRDEIPELRALHAKYKERGLELVGVSVDADGTDDAIKGFMEEFRMTYPVWRDPDERVSAKFLAIGVPATYLIDREGILRWRKTGPIAPNDSTLAAALGSGGS